MWLSNGSIEECTSQHGEVKASQFGKVEDGQVYDQRTSVAVEDAGVVTAAVELDDCRVLVLHGRGGYSRNLYAHVVKVDPVLRTFETGPDTLLRGETVSAVSGLLYRHDRVLVNASIFSGSGYTNYTTGLRIDDMEITLLWEQDVVQEYGGDAGIWWLDRAGNKVIETYASSSIQVNYAVLEVAVDFSGVTVLKTDRLSDKTVYSGYNARVLVCSPQHIIGVYDTGQTSASNQAYVQQIFFDGEYNATRGTALKYKSGDGERPRMDALLLEDGGVLVAGSRGSEKYLCLYVFRAEDSGGMTQTGYRTSASSASGYLVSLKKMEYRKNILITHHQMITDEVEIKNGVPYLTDTPGMLKIPSGSFSGMGTVAFLRNLCIQCLPIGGISNFLSLRLVSPFKCVCTPLDTTDCITKSCCRYNKPGRIYTYKGGA